MACYLCKQKAEYKKAKLNQARQLAKQKAIDEQKTMAIWKEGCLYKWGAEAGSNTVIELVSQYN